MIGELDYDMAHIRMRADNRTEEYVRLHSCAKEPETVDWLKSITAAVFYDVGANVGAYSLIARSRGCAVVAFEPAPANVTRLIENFALNGWEALVVPIALSDTSRVVQLSNTDLAGHTHWIGDEGISVLCAPLDELVYRYDLPRPDAVKIDVDGHEVKVLLGGRLALRDCQTMLIETTPATEEHVASIVGDMGMVPTEVHPHASGVTNTIWRR